MPRCSTAVVTHTFPPATTGDDQPRPGTFVFHATLLVSLHSMGKPRSAECPCPSGPRNAGQPCTADDETPGTQKMEMTQISSARTLQSNGMIGVRPHFRRLVDEGQSP